jgi:ABC-type Fe3+/spermidine/putrescine transport system ATPase subunit
MSDNVVVMDHGVVEQVGPPHEVYSLPASRFVADFLGHSNILKGETSGGRGKKLQITLTNGLKMQVSGSGIATGTPIEMVVRAHKVVVCAPDAKRGGAGVNRFKGRMVDVNYLGGTASYFIDVDGVRMQAINPIEGAMFAEGDAVELAIDPADCVLLDTNGTRIS